MSAPGITNQEVLDFVSRNREAVERAVTKRLLRIGIPEDAIGIRGMPGVEEGAFTRYHRPQGGGNLRPDHPSVISGRWQAGINIDEAIFDSSFNPLLYERWIVERDVIGAFQMAWASASLRTRLDVVAAHEYSEMRAVSTPELRRRFGREWPHYAAILDTPECTLRVSNNARDLLRRHRRALGFK